MKSLEELFSEINTLHNSEQCNNQKEIDQFEKNHNYQFPSDLKTFYRKYKSAKLFAGEGHWLYRFVPINEIHPTRIDIFGEDTDEWAPSSFLTICDVMDGNYIAIDIASKNDNKFNYIDCFHETFGVKGENMIIAKSFIELLELAINYGGESLYYLNENFKGYGFI